MRMTTPDGTKWMVAICAKVFSSSNISRSNVIHLNDPSTGESRQYVLVQNNDGKSPMIVETQSLETDFSSYLVGRHVVKDGNLYVLSPVDPLFFVLQSHFESQTKKPTSWQPFGQALECLCSDTVVRRCITEPQLGHICETLSNDQTNNVVYFKFSDTKAMAWLEKKQERVYQCLLRQEQERHRRLRAVLPRRPHSSTSAEAGGSISSTFYLPEDPMDTTPVAAQTSNESGFICKKTLDKLKLESLQIVCNYLSPEWTTKLLSGLKVPKHEVFPSHQAKKSVTSNHDSNEKIGEKGSGDYISSTTTPVKITPNAKKVEPARSVANKRLDKVNKRGMSSLTSFFGPPKKKATSGKGLK